MPKDNAEPAIPISALAGESSPARPSLPTITSEELLRGGREIQIRHGEDIYVLRRTRNGKLILTK
jgi:hemin uptake protein HemP